ncbi:MAG TPA: formate dehydrogenase accessory sulfurtransferase FdhD [Bacilli bacterium]
MDLPVTINLQTHRYQENLFTVEDDEVAVEYPMTLYVNNVEFATIICSPSNLDELVIGFLAAEGVIKAYDEISGIIIDTGKGLAFVDLHHEFILDPAYFSKRRIASCCGKSRQSFYFFNDAQTAKPIKSDISMTPNQCYKLMKELHLSSTIHQKTGGVHNAALCSTREVLLQYSDIGRHNAIDKIYGSCLKTLTETSDKILVVSGRISSEILLKAAKIGTSLILSKSASTDLAIQLAEELGITTVGFIRENKMNIYTHRQRIHLS